VLTAATVIVLLTGAIDEARAQCLANEHEQLIASDPGEGDRFGEAVAISGDLAVVGASCDDTLGHYSGSAYVFRFDGVSWIEEQKLTASDGAAEDRFGVSVGASEDYIVIGAHMDDDAGQDSGSAYLYRFDPNSLSWVEQQKLLPDDGEPGERFGLAAALFGDTIVVGAYHDNDNGAESGSAYIFIRDDAGTPGDPSDDIWVQHDKLLAPDGAAEDQFGFAVAISDDTAIIGARYDDDLGLSTGSAYVYRRDDGGTPGDPLDDAWYLEEKLVPADGDDWSCFGNAVAIFGNTALLGAYVDDDIYIDGGSAYVFQRSDNGTPADPYDDFWVEQEKLVPSDSETSARFGQSVGIFGDIAVIGAFQKDDAGNDSGAAYVYRRGVAGWQHEAKLQPTDLAAEDRFGVSAAIFGTTALVGAHRNDAGGVDAGAVYVFTAMSDCNENDALDLCDIANGTSADCNFNEIPDECDVMTTEFQMGAGSYVIVPGSTSKLAITHADLDADSDEDLVVAEDLCECAHSVPRRRFTKRSSPSARSTRPAQAHDSNGSK